MNISRRFAAKVLNLVEVLLTHLYPTVESVHRKTLENLKSHSRIINCKILAARAAAVNSKRGTLTGFRGATRDLPKTKQHCVELSR